MASASAKRLQALYIRVIAGTAFSGGFSRCTARLKLSDRVSAVFESLKMVGLQRWRDYAG